MPDSDKPDAQPDKAGNGNKPSADAMGDARAAAAQGCPDAVEECPHKKPEIEVSVPRDFGEHTVLAETAKPAKEQTVTIKSVGTAPLVLGEITIAGTHASDFSKVSDASSGKTLAPGRKSTLKVGFRPTDSGPRAATLNVPSNATKNPQVNRGLTGKGLMLLKLTKVDDHFCPKTEKLDITYKLKGFSGKVVKLEIISKRADFASNPIYVHELTAAERADGTHTIHWDGKSNQGDLKDRYIHPLLSPYKVHLYHDARYTDELPFKVLYHSIVLKNGPWTPDEAEPPEAAEKDWVAYKLNQLGYCGGPVGKDTDDYLKKAIIRYKANHKKMHEQFIGDYDDTITADLKTALKAGDNHRKFPVPAATEDPSKKSILFVEALTYERIDASNDEFSTTRPPHEKNRLNRPLIPAETVIYLKTKANAKALEPEAVGPARIVWRFTDPDQDLSDQYASTAKEPSQTRKYIEKAFKLKSGRSGTNGDNCHKDFAGIRDDPTNNWNTPFLTGDSYVPYKAEQDAVNKVVFTIACEDKATYPKRFGRAGIFFRPSYIAGDDYKFSAELDFTGMPNKADLEKFHGITNEKTKIKDETGTFVIRRFGKIAWSIDWPARKKSYEWDRISGEFKKAYLDIDAGKIKTKKISDVISEADYKTIVTGNTTHTDPTKIKLYKDAMVGVDLPAQGTDDADTYKTIIKTFCHTDYNKKIRQALADKIGADARKEHPVGFLVINFLLHKPLDIKNDPANGDHKVTKANKRFVTWGGSIGLADSIILADQMDPDKVYYVVAHEMGHNYYLLHWENTGETNTSDHDTDDHNCMMSYSDSSFADPGHHAFQEPGKYTPHFCGKCNLSLRGWDVTAGTMAAKSTKGAVVGAEKTKNVKPKIEAKHDYVAVKTADNHPERQVITLSTSNSSFDGNGTLTRSSVDLRLFTSGGTEITFNGADNVFTAANLKSGVKLYGEGANAGQVDLTLTLAGGSLTITDNPATKTISCVSAKLVLHNRTAALSDAAKLDPGGFVNVQKNKKKPRTKLEVKQAQPASFAGNLLLKARNSTVGAFRASDPGSGSKAPKEFAGNADREYWVEGTKASSANKDTGFTLEIKGIKGDVDTAVLTAVNPTIKPNKSKLTVVLDDTGAVPATHPILSFDIEGPPNWYYDVQVVRRHANRFTAGPGLAGAWNSAAALPGRAANDLFSSWTNGQTALQFNGSGKATYAMPLDWWRDVARQKLADFNSWDIYYRVLVFPDAAATFIAYSTGDNDSKPPKMTVQNNLVSLTIKDKGYISGGVKGSVDMIFKVREANTTTMYTIVQWKRGENPVWSGTPPVKDYATVQDYGDIGKANYPGWTIDRLETDPRYWDGVYAISGGGKTATAQDKPGGAIAASDSHDFNWRDFNTRIHLNFEVPASVTVTKHGSAPVYDRLEGKLADPQPVTLVDRDWNVRILQVRRADGTVKVTHPNTYAGP